MPIIKPKKDEEKDEFIKRCMDDKAMKEEFPDNDQRLAICHDSWDKEKEGRADPRETKPGNIEYRTFPVAEFRILKDDDKPKIVGHAAVFNKKSEPIMFFGQEFTEEIAPAAFKNAIKTSDTRALFNHNPDIVLGRKSAGTLKLEEDETGLMTETDPPDTQYVRDVVLTPIERRDVREMSFAFTVKVEKWEENNEKQTVNRTIVEVDTLYDISPVTFPAYPDTAVALRSLQLLKSAEKWREENKRSEPKPPGETPEGWEDITSADADKAMEDLRRLELRWRKLQVGKL